MSERTSGVEHLSTELPSKNVLKKSSAFSQCSLFI